MQHAWSLTMLVGANRSWSSKQLEDTVLSKATWTFIVTYKMQKHVLFAGENKIFVHFSRFTYCVIVIKPQSCLQKEEKNKHRGYLIIIFLNVQMRGLG